VAIGGERLDEDLANPRLVVDDENVGHLSCPRRKLDTEDRAAVVGVSG